MGSIEDFYFKPLKTRNNTYSLLYANRKVGEIRINQELCDVERFQIEDRFLNRFHMHDLNEQLIDEYLSHCGKIKMVCMDKVCQNWEKLGYRKIMTSANKGFSILEKI